MNDELLRLADTFGINALGALRFDHSAMTVTGCQCQSCLEWKTAPANRMFWQLRSRAHPLKGD